MRVIPIAGNFGARGAWPGLRCGRGASGVDAVADSVGSDVLRPVGDEVGCFILSGSWVDARSCWMWKFVVRWVVVENITVYSENFYLPISHIMIWGLGRTSNRVQYDFTDNDRDFWLLNEL